MRYTFESSERVEIPGCPGFYMRVSENVRRCVMFFGLPDTRSGKGGIDCVGTGFWINYDDQGYLVTAKHIAYDLRDIPFLARVNTQDGGSVNIHVDNAKWIEHPDPTVDVAIAVFGAPPHTNYDIAYIPSQMLVTDDFGTARPVGVGDFTYTVGLWRMLSGQKRNLPTVHLGSVAMMPGNDEKIPVRDWRNKNNVIFVEGYLIETHGMPGLSGSPVFIKPTVAVTGERWPDGKSQTPENLVKVPIEAPSAEILLLGLWSGSWDAPPDEVLSVQSGKETRVSVGMGIVVPAQRIKEVLDLEESVNIRKEVKARHAARNAASPDSAISSAASSASHAASSNTNPNHREDFMRLVGAAARKQEPKD
jgi:hypothetical protein